MATLVLILQTLIYFLAAAGGFVIVVTFGITTGKLGGQCVLYAAVDFDSRKVLYGSDEKCHFCFYTSVFACTIYGILMGCYNIFSICRVCKNPAERSELWVVPWVVTNVVVAILLFVSSCIVSVGFNSFCQSIVTEAKSKGATVNCSLTLTIYEELGGKQIGTWDESSYGNMNIVQIASWVCFTLLAGQAFICMFRLWWTQCRRAGGQTQASDDRTVIADVEPTA